MRNLQNDERNGKRNEPTFHPKQLGIPFDIKMFPLICAKYSFASTSLYFCSISDQIPLRKDASYDSVEVFTDECPDDNVILLNVMTCDGKLVSLRLLSTATIKEVKRRAMAELVLSINDECRSADYKLLKSSENMLDLNDSLSISESKLSNCGIVTPRIVNSAESFTNSTCHYR